VIGFFRGKYALVGVTVLLMMVVSACSSSMEPEVGESLFAAGNSGDPAMPFMGQYRDGGLLIATSQSANGVVDGAIFVTQGGHELTVTLDSLGLPSTLVSDGWITVFENVTPTQVDIAIIAPDGTLSVSREVQIDPRSNLSQFIAMASVRGASPALLAANAESELLRGLQIAGFGVDIAVCFTGIVMAGATGVGAPVAVGIALSCANATLTFIAEANPDGFVDPTAAAVFEAGSSVVNLTGCRPSPGGVLSCIGGVLTGAAALRDANAAVEQLQSETVQLARGVLGTGAGAVKFTLTWNNSADLDLWVTDPCGETILWTNSTSASGGRLDVDDTNGHGPENIFWADGTAPGGRYVVKVDHFSGTSPANYQVFMQRPGPDPITILAGIVSTDQTRTITNDFRVESSVVCPSGSIVNGFSSPNQEKKTKGERP